MTPVNVCLKDKTIDAFTCETNASVNMLFWTPWNMFWDWISHWQNTAISYSKKNRDSLNIPKTMSRPPSQEGKTQTRTHSEKNNCHAPESWNSNNRCRGLSPGSGRRTIGDSHQSPVSIAKSNHLNVFGVRSGLFLVCLVARSFCSNYSIHELRLL